LLFATIRQLAIMPLGIFLTHVKPNASKAGAVPNLFNGNVNSKTATTIAGQLGVIPDDRRNISDLSERAIAFGTRDVFRQQI